MKKILAFIIVALSVLLIYLGFKDDKVYYLSLGDGISLGVTPYGGVDYGYSDYVKDYLKSNNELECFINEFSSENFRTTDLISLITENVETEIDGKKKTIQNALIKADLISISIGNNELLSNLKLNTDLGLSDISSRFDKYIVDLDALFDLIRMYSKETIVFTGFYDPTNNSNLKTVFNNLNNRIKELCNQYDIIFIDTYKIFAEEDYITNKNSIYPTKDGYKAISNLIIDNIKPIFIKN